MYARICSFIALLLAALALSGCASYAPYPCPPGYHLGPYGRRCLPNVGAYYPPPPPGYGPPAGYAPPPGPPQDTHRTNMDLAPHLRLSIHPSPRITRNYRETG